MRIALAIAALCMLSGCADFGQKQSTILGTNVPGLGDFDTISKEDKKEADWWSVYYGGKKSEE